jgi:hypothetical protein
VGWWGLGWGHPLREGAAAAVMGAWLGTNTGSAGSPLFAHVPQQCPGAARQPLICWLALQRLPTSLAPALQALAAAAAAGGAVTGGAGPAAALALANVRGPAVVWTAAIGSVWAAGTPAAGAAAGAPVAAGAAAGAVVHIAGAPVAAGAAAEAVVVAAGAAGACPALTPHAPGRATPHSRNASQQRRPAAGGRRLRPADPLRLGPGLGLSPERRGAAPGAAAGTRRRRRVGGGGGGGVRGGRHQIRQGAFTCPRAAPMSVCLLGEDYSGCM